TDDSSCPTTRGLIGHTATSRKIIVANDPLNHEYYNEQIDHLNGKAPRSIACAPLIAKDHVVGVLALYNKKNGNFSDDDIHRLEAFAYPIATAIENASLYEDSER